MLEMPTKSVLLLQGGRRRVFGGYVQILKVTI
jgi:hypothetical protein